MKTLQKYANMAFLLLSVATMVPTYANPVINDQEQVKQEETIVEPQKTETVWYKRPEVREKIYMACNLGGLAIASVAIYLLMLKGEARRSNPEYQWKVNGHVMKGWEVIDGKLIKKLAKICPGCCTCNNN